MLDQAIGEFVYFTSGLSILFGLISLLCGVAIKRSYGELKNNATDPIFVLEIVTLYFQFGLVVFVLLTILIRFLQGFL